MLGNLMNIFENAWTLKINLQEDRSTRIFISENNKTKVSAMQREFTKVQITGPVYESLKISKLKYWKLLEKRVLWES